MDLRCISRLDGSLELNVLELNVHGRRACSRLGPRPPAIPFLVLFHPLKVHLSIVEVLEGDELALHTGELKAAQVHLRTVLQYGRDDEDTIARSALAKGEAACQPVVALACEKGAASVAYRSLIGGNGGAALVALIVGLDVTLAASISSGQGKRWRRWGWRRRCKWRRWRGRRRRGRRRAPSNERGGGRGGSGGRGVGGGGGGGRSGG